MPPKAPEIYRALHQCMVEGLVRSCHDLSEGGLAVTAAEMCIGGRLGLELMIGADQVDRRLFGETNGCLLVEVKPDDCEAFEEHMAGMPLQRIGTVSAEERLEISAHEERGVVSLPVTELVRAWEAHL